MKKIIILALCCACLGCSSPKPNPSPTSAPQVQSPTPTAAVEAPTAKEVSQEAVDVLMKSYAAAALANDEEAWKSVHHSKSLEAFAGEKAIVLENLRGEDFFRFVPDSNWNVTPMKELVMEQSTIWTVQPEARVQWRDNDTYTSWVAWDGDQLRIVLPDPGPNDMKRAEREIAGREKTLQKVAELIESTSPETKAEILNLKKAKRKVAAVKLLREEHPEAKLNVVNQAVRELWRESKD